MRCTLPLLSPALTPNKPAKNGLFRGGYNALIAAQKLTIAI
ncbi:hypothetical protein GAGA_0014 [Paraglaciecola agarilytica NO2]|uniref:Uncharacterized protein n=1 Tax=Paraglaciecola agarilytica NO2 TaxID=1125747 RepID=A0ABQ0I0M2_9ALTE|nr:hypothetical protein GAGA_0014 [Paraglaciecola agarilytica NO2]